MSAPTPTPEALERAETLCDHDHQETHRYCYNCGTEDGEGCPLCVHIALALDAFAAERVEAERDGHARQLIALCNTCSKDTWYGERGVCAECAIAARRKP